MSETPLAATAALPAVAGVAGTQRRSRCLSDLRMAFTMLAREWRSGDLRVLMLALLVAVSGITSVAFFVDRVDRAMTGRAAELLAADLLINGRDPISDEYADKAEALGLATARTLTFRSVVLAGESMRLTQVKAVSSAYPLRGQVKVADDAFASEEQVPASPPSSGEVWLEGRLLAALGLRVGESIELGKSRLRISKVLTYEPDRGGQLFSIAPRVLMNLGDVPATGLVTVGSRVRHRLLVAGPRESVAQYRAQVQDNIPPNARVEGVEDARPELRQALSRARQFLGLAALVGVLLAGAAIAVSAKRHAQRHLDVAALLRCFGSSQASVLRIYVTQILALAVIGGLLGSALGFFAQLGLTAILGVYVVGNLPAPGATPVMIGLSVAIATLVGFGLPPLLNLHRVPPARVLRRDLAGTPVPSWLVYGAGLGSLFAIAWWQAGYLELAAMVMGGALATLGVLALGAYLLVKLVGVARNRFGPAARFAVAGVTRRTGTSVMQVVAFGLGLMALLLLALVRGEMLQEWRRSLPPDAPNFFLVNVQTDEVVRLQAELTRQQISVDAIHPMVRGRLTAINGEAVTPQQFTDPRAQRLAAREANLSFSADKPEHNPLLEGRWWQPGEDGWSVEAGIAKSLGLDVGDTLRFHIAGLDVEGPVTSLRQVKWDSFNVNFFYLASPDLLRDYPATYITSFHLDPNRRDVLAALVREFPSVTVIDVDALMNQVRGIMDHATMAIEYVFAFTILAGLMVLFATIHATLDERRHEAAILRTLGAQRRLLLGGLLTEFALLGGLAGFLAAATATATAAVVASQVFGFTFDGNAWTWLAGTLFGAGIVTLAGFMGTHSVIRQPPIYTLRSL